MSMYNQQYKHIQLLRMTPMINGTSVIGLLQVFNEYVEDRLCVTCNELLKISYGYLRMYWCNKTIK